jgi:hypothetical protein
MCVYALPGWSLSYAFSPICEPIRLGQIGLAANFGIPLFFFSSMRFPYRLEQIRLVGKMGDLDNKKPYPEDNRVSIIYKKS